MAAQPGWEYTDISGERTFDTPWSWWGVRISYRDADDASKGKSETRQSLSQAEMKKLLDALSADGWVQESKKEYREVWQATYARRKR